jgi:hypothetical protein
MMGSEILTAEERERLRRVQYEWDRREISRADVRGAIDRLAASHEAMEREVARYDRALQSLTPGGSEYVRDPDRCVEYVRRGADMQARWRSQLVKERDALRTLVEELAAALRAEVEYTDDGDGPHAMDCGVQTLEACTCSIVALLARADAETGGRDGG